MTRTGLVIAFTIGMVVAWGFPVMPSAAAPGFGWGAAELIETDDAGDAFGASVAVDPQGNAVAVWTQSDGTTSNIWSNRFAPGAGWGTAEVIETDAGFAVAPQVAIEAAGNATAVWRQWDGVRQNIWSNRFAPGAGWGTAEVIKTDAGPAAFPQLAVDSQGNAVAVWHQRFDGTTFDIWANRFVPGAGWGTAELIETNAGHADPPQVAVDPQGNAVAVWMQDDGTRSNIWANRFVPGAGWGTAEVIKTDRPPAHRPQVAVDSQGNAVAVWMQSFDIWANRFVPGVGWGTAEVIETGGGLAVAPQVAIEAAGYNATAVWTQSGGTRSNIWANRFVAGIGWGTAEVIDTDTGPAGLPGVTAGSLQVAVDSQGNAVAVWSQDDGTRSNIWANRFAEDIVPPNLVITSPADDEMLTSTLVAVAGTASDDIAVAQVELSTDGTTWVLATGTTSWYGAVKLVEGSNTIFSRATDKSGNTVTVSIAVTVDTVKPTAVAGEDQTASVGAIASFDASASSDDVAIVSYAWDFGDGTTGTGETATHIYTDPGIYTVTLTVRDAAGNADTDVLIVTVEAIPVNPIPEVVTLAVVGAIAAAAAVVALLLWRRRAGGKEKA